MAKDKKDKGNGGMAAERTDVEQQPAADGAGEVPPAAQPCETTATEAPQDEPGPEDFDRHSGARLLEDQGADLRLQEELERRLRKRGNVIAKRLRASGGVNATVEINGVAYVARQRPKCPNEMMLSEAVTHTRATLA